MASISSGKNKGTKESDWNGIVERLRSHIKSETVYKLFEEDPQFILEVIKILYEDSLEFRTKLEILLMIEQDCCGLIHKNSVDQAVSSLIDIFETEPGKNKNMEIKEQLLLTATTILVEHDELMDQTVGAAFISKLMEILQKTNNVSNRRVRAMACCCLVQVEHWKPGVLWKWKDRLSQMVRDERTDVSQDYSHLLLTVITNSLKLSSEEDDERGVLQAVSYTMENVALLTGPGLVSVMECLVTLVQSTHTISPTVFKPFLLHYTPCMAPCVLFVLLYIQNKFRGEILSPAEETMLLLKVVGVANQPSVSSKTSLLVLQWLVSFVQQTGFQEQATFQPELHRVTQPSVFDQLSIHTCKLYLHCMCTSPAHSTGLTQDVHYLCQLSETTGGIPVTRALYYVLFSHVRMHSGQEVHAKALSVTKKLFQKFPHLIPLIVDFLQNVQVSLSDQKFHLEILSVLHKAVLSVPLSALLSNFQNFLQVWILSAQDSSMNLQKQLRRMLELAREANVLSVDDWTLGSLLLSICRTMLLHHHTDLFYSQMGDLLSYMMHHFTDPDIRDFARFYYALLTLTSNQKVKEILKADLVDGINFGENLASFLPGSMVHVMPADIRVLDSAPIQYDRNQVSVEFQEVNEEEKPDQASTKDQVSWYRSHQDKLQSCLRCDWKLSVKEEAECDELIAISLTVGSQLKDGTIDEIDIPFMSKQESTDVVLRFHPTLPLPCALDVRSVYSQEKATFQCDLDPICLTLVDFLVPFPWEVFPKDVDKQEVFEELWNQCTASLECKGVESVKTVSYGCHVLTSLWEDARVDEVLAPPEDDKTSSKGHFLFFMVPCYHLLFRTTSRAADTVVEIASDFPQVLDFVDDFLDNVPNHSQS